jgi:hypothetical protein
MNYAKLIKILPLCDSPVDAEALAALRALQRALAPETFGDIARMVGEAFAVPEIEAPKAQPFNGFAPAQARKKPEKPAGDNWVWDATNWAWFQRIKPAKPPGDGWKWYESSWHWIQVPYPQYVSRYQTCVWSELRMQWILETNYSKIMTSAMEVMNHKLGRADKARMTEVFTSAMAETHIAHSDLLKLEQLERYHQRHPISTASPSYPQI